MPKTRCGPEGSLDAHQWTRGNASVTGTSIAAPHVAGLVAMLRGAFPAAPPGQIADALRQGAVDLGPAGPDDETGHGLEAGLAAYQILAAAPPPPPQPPVANADAYALSQDSSASFAAPGVLANDGSPSGRPLTALLVAGPTAGTLSLQASGALSYTPNPGFYGTDGFTYQGTDDQLASNVASVSLTVTRVNRPPVAVNDARWQYGSGFPISQPAAVKPRIILEDQDLDGTPETPVIATSNLNNGGDNPVIFDVDFDDRKLNSRKPIYHRLDFRINAFADWWDLDWTIYLDIINLYNRSNVIGYDYYVEENLTLGRETTTMLPIIPTLGFSVKF